jgi:hypothetical protein
VVSDPFLVLASQGPFGPTPATCLAVIAVALAPVVVAAIAARSLLSADPLPRWALAVALAAAALAAAAGLAVLLAVTAGDSPGRGGLGRVWQLAAGGAVLLPPAVLLREGLKRGWVRRPGRRRRLNR